jgi:5'-nucleotidase/UDP-sugar diphosphatase
MKKAIVLVLMALMLASLSAQIAAPDLGQLAKDVSKEYVIKKGDTLKGIADAEYGAYSLWPAVWAANRDAVSHPDLIEPGAKITLYKLPLSAPAVLDPLLKAAYAQVYDRYVDLGSDWIPQRRWALLEAERYDPELFSANAGWIRQEDRTWFAKRGLVAALPALPAEVKITIAHTNDMHSRAIESKTEIGYSRIATLVAGLRAENRNTLVIDAGDVFHGLPIANLERGASIVRLMNAVGYDYMTTGNHDYNYGIERALELRDLGKFKILAANVYKDGARLFGAYDIRDVGGVKVAVFGLATPETLYKADPKGIVGVDFKDPIEEAKAILAEIKGKYDVVVCISHLGIDKSSEVTSDMLAAAVPEIDLIIDGHSHSSLATEIANNPTGTLIASADANGVSLGVVELTVARDRTVVSKLARSISAAAVATVAPDTKVKAEADAVMAAQGPMLAEKVGVASMALEGKREIVRTSQTNLGLLIANSMLYVTGADVAYIGGGGVRDSIPAGDITKKHIFTILPFGNYIQTATLKGSEFKAIVEHGVGKLPAADGRFPQFAGLTYTLDAAQPAGSRVSNIMIQGAPVDEGKDYLFAAPNFDFNGGDGFTMLMGKTLQDFPSDAEVFMAYVQHLGTVTPENIAFAK